MEITQRNPTLPGAGQTTTTGDDTVATTTSVVQGAGGTPPRLVKISKGPVALGEAVVYTPATSSTTLPEVSVSYVERQSGNVFRYSARDGTITRTSNRTVPGIQSATWLPNASVAFVRYLSGADSNTINTFALSADGSNGFFLPQNLSDIVVSSTSVLTLASGVNGSTASLLRTDGSGATTVFTTPLTSLRASFAGKAQYLAFTKPSAALGGAAFMVGADGRFSRLAGPLNGLVALASPSGKWVLISYMMNGSMQTKLVNTSTNESLPLPVATIADKCVWAANDSSLYCGVPVSPSANNVYPDDWYQGAVAFSDRIWKIDVAGRFAQLALDFSKETGEALDAHGLAIDSAGSTLVFVNKRGGALWAYQL